MKRFLLICLCLVSSVSAQQATGGEVAIQGAMSQSVQAAAQKLGNEVLQSNFRYAIDKMYPRWKARQAKRLGSEAKLLAAFNSAGAKMQEAGVTLDSFTALSPTSAYRVHPKLKAGRSEIRSSADLDYQILIFIPTKMKMTFLMEGQPKRSFMRESFQVAIAQEGSNQWSFIDGSTIRMTDLRSMFPLLPYDLVLPVKEDKEL